MSHWSVHCQMRRRIGALANGTEVVVIKWLYDKPDEVLIKSVVGNYRPFSCKLVDLEKWTVKDQPQNTTGLRWSSQSLAERFAMMLETKANNLRLKMVQANGRIPRRRGI